MEFELWDRRMSGDSYVTDFEDSFASFNEAVEGFLECVNYHRQGGDLEAEREFLQGRAKHRGIDESGSVSKTLEKHGIAMQISVELHLSASYEGKHFLYDGHPLLVWSGDYDYDTDKIKGGCLEWDFGSIDPFYLTELSKEQLEKIEAAFARLA